MKYLGVDFGLKRVGLATSEGELTSPFKIIEVSGFQDAVKKVMEIVKSDRFDKVVVGLPQGQMGQTVLGFITALRRFGLDAVEADETLSSQKATLAMIELKRSKKDRQFNDAIAAAIILQNYLDEKRQKGF